MAPFDTPPPRPWQQAAAHRIRRTVIGRATPAPAPAPRGNAGAGPKPPPQQYRHAH